MKNSSKAPHKKSQIDKKTNRYVYMMFGIEIIMCLISITVLGIWTSIDGSKHWYLSYTSDYFTYEIISKFFLILLFKKC